MWAPFNHPSEEAVESVKILKKNRYSLILDQPQQFIGYPIIVALMAVLQVFTVIFGSRGFLFFGFDITAGWLILMPINFYLFQIVAECYGWQHARQIVWLNFIVNVTMTIILFSFKFLPFNGSNSQITHSAYTTLFNKKWIAAATMMFSMFIADYITSAIMCWSKFHWKGKLLIVRMAILHCISEIIINAGDFIVDPMNGYSFAECWRFSLDSFYARSIVMICFLPMAKLVIWWIQNRLEGVIVFDLNIKFAPFKFKINPNESVQFIAQEWREMSDVEKNKLDIAKFVMEYLSSQATVKIKIY
jgi:uncharacterized PurR-regulated membrane protein YhhQ (DUF165 family)